jgi:hypothetical protein
MTTKLFQSIKSLTGDQNISNATIDELDLTGPLKASDGTASLPELTFTNDNTTGIFRDGSGNLAFSKSGASKFKTSVNGVCTNNQGTVSNTAYGLNSDESTGLYAPTATSLGFAVSGVKEMSIDATSTSALQTTDSTSSTTGALKSAGGLGVTKSAFVGTNLTVGTQIFPASGTAAAPSISFGSNLSGFYQTAGNGIGLSVGGANVLDVESTGVTNNATADTTSTTTGAFVCQGGGAFGKSITYGNQLFGAQGTTSLPSISFGSNLHGINYDGSELTFIKGGNLVANTTTNGFSLTRTGATSSVSLGFNSITTGFFVPSTATVGVSANNAEVFRFTNANNFAFVPFIEQRGSYQIVSSTTGITWTVAQLTVPITDRSGITTGTTDNLPSQTSMAAAYSQITSWKVMIHNNSAFALTLAAGTGGTCYSNGANAAASFTIPANAYCRLWFNMYNVNGAYDVHFVL